jgi:tetratricopeptide (TPR) repeat protein
MDETYTNGVLTGKDHYLGGKLRSRESYVDEKITSKMIYKENGEYEIILLIHVEGAPDKFEVFLYDKNHKKIGETRHCSSFENAEKGIDSEKEWSNKVQKYRGHKKPVLSEETRKLAIQAQDAVEQKNFYRAQDLYKKALETAPWWSQGHYNRAEILAEIKLYAEARSEMKKYLLLEPNAKDARAAKDEISRWEGRLGK